MRTKRFTLLSALLLSLALHAFFIGGGELALPDFYIAPDEVLERKQPTHVQQVQLATRPPTLEKAPASQGLRMVAIKPAATRQPAKAKKAPPEAKRKVADASDTGPSAEETSADEATPAPVAEEAPPEAIPAPAPEPAPAFPVQLVAQLDARIGGIPVLLNQSWNMEGYRYFIDQNAKKFGFRARMTSEGRISPEGGLHPEKSETLLNDEVKSFSSYAGGVIRFGRPTNPREVPLAIVPQDMASLPFHLAVTFNGQPQSVMVTTGKKVYQVRFFLDAEEKVKLPIGTLRTLHLYGERFDTDLREMVRAYELWLAPDFLNYPVKVLGHLSSGERFEYRIKSLEIEGKLVLGSKDDSEIAAPEEAIPEWLQQRTQQSGLKAP
ncbi:MAG: hypothetical protein K0S46_1646 [Moraxellaceae bacterium]|jgi:hypothetical protein|nr:hypothetical protein [Moraxellaceae bacterium]